MATIELFPMSEKATDTSRLLYQRKIGGILFAAITTRPDIAFAASKLSKFNRNPGEIYHKVADCVIIYLYNTKGLALQYGSWGGIHLSVREGETPDQALTVATDVLFADNTMDWKSS